jgi:zinc protease
VSTPVLDRRTAPRPKPPPGVRIPPVERFTLAGGLPVIVVANHDVPIVNLQLLMHGGSGALRRGEAGLAAMTSRLLDEGTATRSSMEIGGAFEQLGAAFYSTAGFDTNEVELNVLSARLPEALDLFAEVVIGPTFPDVELDRIRQERLARIVQELDDPRALATHSFARVVFGEGHPWGNPLIGTPRTLERLERADVVRFHRQHFHANGATLIAAGDVTADRLEAMLARTMGAWEGRTTPQRAIPNPPPLTSPRLCVVHRPDAPQSEVRVGRVAVSRETDDYFALTVMNTILGGSFTSRLNANLREGKGYTYGAGSGFSMRRSPGPFVAQASVHTPVTAEAVVEIRAELRRMGEELVPEEELERAKRYVALRLPQRFESASDITARLSEIVLYELGDDYFAKYVERIMDVKADDVQRVAEQHVNPDRMVVVVAGDQEAVQGPLERLDLAPVEVLPSMPWPRPEDRTNRKAS